MRKLFRVKPATDTQWGRGTDLALFNEGPSQLAVIQNVFLSSAYQMKQ